MKTSAFIREEETWRLEELFHFIGLNSFISPVLVLWENIDYSKMTLHYSELKIVYTINTDIKTHFSFHRATEMF